MNTIRRWLRRSALTYGQLVFIIAAVAAANGIQAITHISDTMTVLVVVGLVIAEYAAWGFTRWILRRNRAHREPHRAP